MKKKGSKKSLSKKSKDSKDKSIASKKSKSSKSSSKSKSKSKSKEKDSKKNKSKKDIEVVTDNKNIQPQPNNNIPQTTIDLNTNLEETPIKNANNFPNFNYRNSKIISNGYMSPNSAKNINFGSQDNFNLRAPNINTEEINCEGCSEQKAICYCTECKKSFCPQCDNQIYTIPAMKNHIRRPIQEIAILKKYLKREQ